MTCLKILPPQPRPVTGTGSGFVRPGASPVLFNGGQGRAQDDTIVQLNLLRESTD